MHRLRHELSSSDQSGSSLLIIRPGNGAHNTPFLSQEGDRKRFLVRSDVSVNPVNFKLGGTRGANHDFDLARQRLMLSAISGALLGALNPRNDLPKEIEERELAFGDVRVQAGEEEAHAEVGEDHGRKTEDREQDPARAAPA